MALVTIDLDVEVVQVPEQLRMNALNVVALVERVHGGLPVAIPFHRDVAGLHHALEVIGVEVQRDRIEIVGERPRIGIEREPHEAPPFLAADLGEAVGRRTLGKCIDIGDAPVAPVEIVFPVVVQALERERGSRGSAPAGTQSIAAMLADVVEAAHAAVGLAHDHDGLRADLGHDESPGCGISRARPATSQTLVQRRSIRGA